MFRFSLVFFSATLSASTVWSQSVTVTLTLQSPQSGQMVSPGASVDWTLSASVPASGSSGLAAVCVDLAQEFTNPSFVNVLPAGGVPSGMADFSRPLGISNPGEGGAATGYIGVQRSPTGQSYKNLIQIGGAQNTFGSTPPPELGVGQSATVVSGIGQSGTPQIIASGSFPAPGTAGTYTFLLENAMANVLTAGSPPPAGQHWPVSQADMNISGAQFTFQVQGMLRGDLNCDGVVDTGDISHFVQALVDPAGYAADHDGSPYSACQRIRADMNADNLEDGLDIRSFVDALLSS
ncbi:MAG TPA: hypothetical protein VMV94_17505 [Phycisphaerae bacterium]|nr:hypothetical protein [Phycisphaerae bacterium]